MVYTWNQPYLLFNDSMVSFSSLEIHGQGIDKAIITAPNGRFKVVWEQQRLPVTVDAVQSVRAMRLQCPSKCPNSTRHILSTTPSDHNWAPYYFRCTDLYHQRDPPKRQWIQDGLMSKGKLFYDHIFKAGGSTIMGEIPRLLRNGILKNLTLLDRSSWQKMIRQQSQQSVLDHFIDDDTVSFSFVRDPIDKFLSAFYEANYREFNVSHSEQRVESGLADRYKDKSGIQILRIWIHEMERRLADERRNAILLQNRKTRPIKTFVNIHLMPNMYFLEGEDHQSDIPFNFIGDLQNFAQDFPQIMEPFIVDEEMKGNHTKFTDLIRNQRDKSIKSQDPNVRRFEVDRSELNDEDLRKICDIYWLDYLCFPFDLPPQCDIDKLIADHYGLDVEYKECY